MMATAAMEHKMIGHMKPPPARIISHIALCFLNYKSAGMILDRRHLRYGHEQKANPLICVVVDVALSPMCENGPACNAG
jgi:hypothetical protein